MLHPQFFHRLCEQAGPVLWQPSPKKGCVTVRSRSLLLFRFSRLFEAVREPAVTRYVFERLARPHAPRRPPSWPHRPCLRQR